MKSEFYYQKERFGEYHFNFFCEFKELEGTWGSEDLRTSKSTLGPVRAKWVLLGIAIFQVLASLEPSLSARSIVSCVLHPALALVCTFRAFACQVSFWACAVRFGALYL